MSRVAMGSRCLLGALLTAASPDFHVMATGRLLYGIGAGLQRIIQAIVRDEGAVLSVSIATPEPCSRCGVRRLKDNS